MVFWYAIDNTNKITFSYKIITKYIVNIVDKPFKVFPSHIYRATL